MVSGEMSGFIGQRRKVFFEFIIKIMVFGFGLKVRRREERLATMVFVESYEKLLYWWLGKAKIRSRLGFEADITLEDKKRIF